MKTAEKLGTKYLKIRFSFDEKELFYQMLEKIKELPGRRYDPKTKSWIIPKTDFTIQKLNGLGWTYDGATNTKELHQILTENIMIRRLKKDVMSDLPEKIISIIPIQINNKEEYQYAEKDFIKWLWERKGKITSAESLNKIEYLKQLAVKGKLDSIKDWIKNVIFANDEKLVIMATHHETIDDLSETFKDISVKLDGRNSQIKRNEVVNKFQNDDKIKLFIGNIKATGVGITLTASSKLAFVELGWTPGEHSQASDRIHRIGQKNSCNIYYFFAEKTVESSIINILDRKKIILDSVHDGFDTKENNLLQELLKQYKED